MKLEMGQEIFFRPLVFWRIQSREKGSRFPNSKRTYVLPCFWVYAADGGIFPCLVGLPTFAFSHTLALEQIAGWWPTAVQTFGWWRTFDWLDQPHHTREAAPGLQMVSSSLLCPNGCEGWKTDEDEAAFYLVECFLIGHLFPLLKNINTLMNDGAERAQAGCPFRKGLDCMWRPWERRFVGERRQGA